MIRRWKTYRGIQLGVERRRYGSRWFSWCYYLDGSTWRHLSGDPWPYQVPPWAEVVRQIESEPITNMRSGR